MNMPATEHESIIERILALTRRARERAQADDWDAAVAAEGERRPLLHALFDEPVPAALRNRVAAAIREVLASDAGLIALAAAGRGMAAAESRQLRRGRTATALYADTAARRVNGLPYGGNRSPLARQQTREVIDLP